MFKDIRRALEFEPDLATTRSQKKPVPDLLLFCLRGPWHCALFFVRLICHNRCYGKSQCGSLFARKHVIAPVLNLIFLHDAFQEEGV